MEMAASLSSFSPEEPDVPPPSMLSPREVVAPQIEESGTSEPALVALLRGICERDADDQNRHDDGCRDYGRPLGAVSTITPVTRFISITTERRTLPPQSLRWRAYRACQVALAHHPWLAADTRWEAV